MKRFELFEYDKETESLELDEGVRDWLSSAGVKIWKSISATLSKLKAGQKARIPLITAESSLAESYITEGAGWERASFGPYAELLSVVKLLEKMEDKGFHVLPSDIEIAENRRKDKKKIMDDDIKSGKKTGRSFRGNAVIDKSTIQNYRAHMKRLDLQADALAERAFREMTSNPSSIFTDYRVKWSKAKVKKRFGRVNVRDDGATGGAAHKDTADLLIERWGHGKLRKKALETRGLSLKTYQGLSSKRGLSKTEGTGFNVWVALTRALALDAGVIDLADAKGMKGLLSNPELSEKVFEHYGIRPTDHMEKYRVIAKRVDAANAEKKGDLTAVPEKVWREYNKEARDEHIDNWMMVYEKSLKNPKLKKALIKTLRTALDISYWERDKKSPSAVLVSAHWAKESGQIKTYSNLGPELEEIFDLKDEEFDYEIKPNRAGNNIVITFIHKGPTPLKFWSGKLSVAESESGFIGTAGNEITSAETIKIDFDTGKFRTKSEAELAEIENKKVQAHYSLQSYVQQKGWGRNEDKQSKRNTGNVPFINDIKEWLPNVTTKSYDLNGTRYEEMIDAVAGLALQSSTPQEEFRPYEKILNDWADAKKKQKISPEYQKGSKSTGTLDVPGRATRKVKSQKASANTPKIPPELLDKLQPDRYDGDLLNKGKEELLKVIQNQKLDISDISPEELRKIVINMNETGRKGDITRKRARLLLRRAGLPVKESLQSFEDFIT